MSLCLSFSTLYSVCLHGYYCPVPANPAKEIELNVALQPDTVDGGQVWMAIKQEQNYKKL